MPADTQIPTPTKSMDDIVALCKRRGFVYPASEIYGGINGFWDYGPLGVTLKNNLRDRWWRDMVECPPDGPPELTDGNPVDIVGLDTSIIQNPKVWEASGHVGGFNDPMVEDKQTNQRFRADQLFGLFLIRPSEGMDSDASVRRLTALIDTREIDEYGMPHYPTLTAVAGSAEEAIPLIFALLKKINYSASENDGTVSVQTRSGQTGVGFVRQVPEWMLSEKPEWVRSPFTQKLGEVDIEGPSTDPVSKLMKPRDFNLMLGTEIGAVDPIKAYLRPETAQGIFINYKNVLDTSRVKVPFGIAQIGKSFRNEVTPRNFIFRSREFEQMEMEWFCRPDDAQLWYEFWVDQRMNWWQSLGVAPENLKQREHDHDELAHYSTASADIEYRYPFTSPGFGELEGIAHRGDFDLCAHQEHSRQKLEYFDQEAQLKAKAEGLSKDEIDKRSKYMPHVIEPAAGLTRGMLVLICEAFTPTPDRKGSSVVMKFDPTLAPIHAGIFPLVNKDGMPEVASKLYKDLRTKFRCQYDVKQSIGKRYARMDEAGTPFCFTIDGETLTDQTITVRDRDTASQERIGIDRVGEFLEERVR